MTAALLFGCLLLGASPPPAARVLEARPFISLDDTLAGLVAELGNDAELDAEAGRELLTRAFSRFRGEVDAWRLDGALHLAEALHRRAAATWSAMSLALLQTRLGLGDAAEATLSQQLARTGPGAERRDLLERLGLARLGAGRRGEALSALGRAWYSGSTNAGQVLGALALSGGQAAEARRLFGALLAVPAPGAGARAQTPPWALRGWGLAMVGGANQPVADQRASKAPAKRSPRATSAPSDTTR